MGKRYAHSTLEYTQLRDEWFNDKFRVDKTWSIDLQKHGWAFQVFDENDSLIYEMSQLGVLTVHAGDTWDGSSGPTPDDKSDPEASLAHDKLYGAMRRRHLPLKLRKWADQVYRDLLIQHGKSKFVAWYRYFGLRLIGRPSAKPT